MLSDPRTDVEGTEIWPGDQLIMARPFSVKGYGKTTAAKLERVTLVRFTDHGMTLRSADGTTFNTPYRADKFLKVEA